MTASTTNHAEREITMPTMVLVRMLLARSLPPALTGLTTKRKPAYAIIIGATKPIAIVMRNWMTWSITTTSIPQPAAQVDCTPVWGMIGPRNGIDACTRCGKVSEASANTATTKDALECMRTS
jgi:hypothetical protein